MVSENSFTQQLEDGKRGNSCAFRVGTESLRVILTKHAILLLDSLSVLVDPLSVQVSLNITFTLSSLIIQLAAP